VVYEPPKIEPPVYAEVVIDTNKHFLSVFPETAKGLYTVKVDNIESTLVANDTLVNSVIDYDVVDYGEISEIYTDFDQNVTQALISEPIKLRGPADNFLHGLLDVDTKTKGYLHNPAVLYGAIGKNIIIKYRISLL
jgi:hypothetical protein